MLSIVADGSRAATSSSIHRIVPMSERAAMQMVTGTSRSSPRATIGETVGSANDSVLLGDEDGVRFVCCTKLVVDADGECAEAELTAHGVGTRLYTPRTRDMGGVSEAVPAGTVC